MLISYQDEPRVVAVSRIDLETGKLDTPDRAFEGKYPTILRDGRWQVIAGDSLLHVMDGDTGEIVASKDLESDWGVTPHNVADGRLWLANDRAWSVVDLATLSE